MRFKPDSVEEAPGVSLMCVAESSFIHTGLPDLLTQVFSSDAVEGRDVKPLQQELHHVTIK